MFSGSNATTTLALRCRIRKWASIPLNLDRRFSLCTRRYHQEASQLGRFALHFATDSVGHSVRENAHTTSLAGHPWRGNKHRFQQPTESIRFLTGH